MAPTSISGEMKIKPSDPIYTKAKMIFSVGVHELHAFPAEIYADFNAISK